MKWRVLAVLLALSLVANLLLFVVPHVSDQHRIATAIMGGISARLFDRYLQDGFLPYELSTSEVDFVQMQEIGLSYERIDSHHATMKALVDKRQAFVTTYIGCDIDMTRNDLRNAIQSTGANVVRPECHSK